LAVLQADVTAGNAQDLELLKRFRLFGPPGSSFSSGRTRDRRPAVIGYQNADRFLKTLESAANL